MKSKKKQKKVDHVVCFCMSVHQSKIEKAIKDGANRLDQIFDQCNAGVGSCKGSCRPYIQNMIDTYIESGEFPENPRPKKR